MAFFLLFCDLATGTVLVQGHIRGHVNGYLDAEVKGVLHGQLEATVSTGGEITEQEEESHA